jgi:hypothetical protein
MIIVDALCVAYVVCTFREIIHFGGLFEATLGYSSSNREGEHTPPPAPPNGAKLGLILLL